jgi:hypothetical protein
MPILSLFWKYYNRYFHWFFLNWKLRSSSGWFMFLLRQPAADATKFSLQEREKWV